MILSVAFVWIFFFCCMRTVLKQAPSSTEVDASKDSADTSR